MCDCLTLGLTLQRQTCQAFVYNTKKLWGYTKSVYKQNNYFAKLQKIKFAWQFIELKIVCYIRLTTYEPGTSPLYSFCKKLTTILRWFCEICYFVGFCKDANAHTLTRSCWYFATNHKLQCLSNFCALPLCFRDQNVLAIVCASGVIIVLQT